jgi:hypothetical protein
MTAREYLEKKYPQMSGDKWNTHDVIDDNWVAQMMTEFAEMKIKNMVSKIEPIFHDCNICGKSLKEQSSGCDKIYCYRQFVNKDCKP